MYTKVNGEQQVQILSPNFSISPSNEDYVLNISANGRDFSPLFAVSAGVTRLVSNVAPGSYYKLVGNQSEVVINWQRMCATEGSSFDPSVLDPYWTSAQTEEAITEAVSGLATEQYVQDALSGVSLEGYWTSAETQDAIDEAISGFTPSANSPIIPAITTQAEYESISGNVKTGDLIQVYNVDINGDNNPEFGLFEANVQEEEDQGVIRKLITWGRRDNENSVTWSFEDYPWMAENDVYPIDINFNSFLIAPDVLAEDEEYNGIGFDIDGKPVITHFAPQYDEETGEVTGITREDRDILGELDTIDEAFSAISETQRVAAAGLNRLEERIDELSAATPSVDLSGYYTSAQTDAAISAATSGKADKANVLPNYGALKFPAWNADGIIGGEVSTVHASSNFYLNGTKREPIFSRLVDAETRIDIYAPQSAGTAGDILVSTGRGAPVWSAVTFPDVSNYVTSAQVETQIVEKNYINSGDVKSQVEAYNYATVSQIPTVPTSNTAFTNDAGYITDAAIENFVTSAQVETQITLKGYATVSQIPTVPTSNTAFTNDAGYITSAATADMVTSTYVSTIWKGTAAEYEAITVKDPNTFYIIVSSS